VVFTKKHLVLRARIGGFTSERCGSSGFASKKVAMWRANMVGFTSRHCGLRIIGHSQLSPLVIYNSKNLGLWIFMVDVSV